MGASRRRQARYICQRKTLQQETAVKYGPKNDYRAVINHKSFSIDFFRDIELHMKLSGKGLMNMDHWRLMVDKAGQKEGEELKEEGEDEGPR